MPSNHRSFVAGVFHSSDRQKFLGSAVFVSKRHAVTCAHVVKLGVTKSAQTVWLWLGDGAAWEARVVAREGDGNTLPDLALLELVIECAELEPAISLGGGGAGRVTGELWEGYCDSCGALP